MVRLNDGPYTPYSAVNGDRVVCTWRDEKGFSNARTANHSPLKSLAVLLMDELSLRPILVTKPHEKDTWGLDAASNARLTECMRTRTWQFGPAA
jgi:hypothetical protein